RRRPRALRDGREAVVVAPRAPPAEARRDLGGIALGVEARAQVRAVDRGRRPLERARIVDRVACAELAVLELDRAARRIRSTRPAQPRILDAFGEIALVRPGVDPHDLDRLDRVASIARVVALAEAQLLEALLRQRRMRVRGTPGLLDEAPDRAYLEA